METITKLKVRGSLAAMFLSGSITALLIGFLVFTRGQLGFLQLYAPAGKLSGIFVYSYLAWLIVWLASYLVLRNRKEVGTLRTWVVIFAASVIIGTLLAEASLNWASFFG